jgi:hypothetical protein
MGHSPASVSSEATHHELENFNSSRPEMAWVMVHAKALTAAAVARARRFRVLLNER